MLKRIKSKYVIQNILLISYSDMKSILKLIKHNKYLLNKLDININEYYKYKIQMKIEKKGVLQFLSHLSIQIVFQFIPILIYTIYFYVNGKFNDEILKKGYDKKKKKFVDFMDNYILLAYLIYIVVLHLFNITLNICNLFAIKGDIKIIFFFVFYLVEITHYILYSIKYNYTQDIIIDKKPFGKNIHGLYDYDFTLLMIFFITYFAIIIIDIKDLFKSNCNSSLSGIDDKKIFTLNQIKGININKYELPSDFIDLNRKLKNELIFTKENIEKYKYKLNINQIQLIKNINDIRNQNKIPGLIYNEELPDFIINEKTKLFFYPNENIYKISNNLYIFK